MLKKKTVLVIGAGASVPYGFPTNEGLVNGIREGLRDTSSEFRRTLILAGASNDDLETLKNAINSTQFFSIDTFLQYRAKLRPVGKLAIAATLIPCEKPDVLLTGSVTGQHWYRLLFNHLVGRGGFDGHNLSVITFNYDRSLEQYLFDALRQEFGMPEEEAVRTVRQVNFIHPHGRLGYPAWWTTDNPDTFRRPYTASLDPDALAQAAKQIEIVSEHRTNAEFDYLIESTLREAEVIGFLGFGYHDVLMDRLRVISIANDGGRPVYGSAFGLPLGRRQELERSIPKLSLGADDAYVLRFLLDSGLLYQGGL